MSALPRRSGLIPLAVLAATFVPGHTLAQDADGWRTIEIETTEVTAPDVAITPDGESLIFTLLGHLFRLPVEGGEAEQLTFGPYYDDKPAVSPDGAQVAFQSDRDGSEGNIFLLELATRDITQLTNEPWADAPSWAPDGQSVVYLRLVREAWNASDAGPNRNSRRPPPPAMVRRVWLDGSEPETLRAEVSEVRSPFHMPDGRVGWAVVERDTNSPRTTTRIEVMAGDGRTSTIRTLDGVADAIVALDDEFFVRRYIPVRMMWERAQQREVLRVPLAERPGNPILPVTDVMMADFRGEPRFVLSADEETLYLGNLGRLWRVSPDEGEMEAIPFQARVTMEVLDPTPPPRWTLPEPGATKPPTSIQFPRLSPDGRRLLFVAASYLWEQPLEGGPIRQLTTAVTQDPAFSPDGSRVAFRGSGVQVLQVFDLASEQTLTELRLILGLTWTRDGQALIGLERAPGGRSMRLVAAGLSGTRETLTEVPGRLSQRSPYTAISPDGQRLYFVAEEAPDSPTVFRLSLLDRGVAPEPVTQLAMGFAYGRVSPDGKWFAYRPPNKLEIRVVPLGGEKVSAEDSRPLSPVGGTTGFTFTHDGSALVYAGAGTSVWRHPLNGDEPVEIPVRLELERPVPPPPTLIRGVRMLDLEAGDFGSETSMLIEDGRIRWTGEERELPQGTVILDAGGRFAIPGLFDMHAHANLCGGSAGRRLLAHGVTSVRNMGGPVVEISQAADREFTGYGSPRCFYTGYIIEGEQGSNRNQYFLHATDEADARTQVRLMHDWGASFIKPYEYLPWPLHRAAAEEARQLGLPVVAHGQRPVKVIKGVTLGYRLTHTRGPLYGDILRLLAAVGMRSDPTLGSHVGVRVLGRREPQRFSGPQPIYPLGDDALLGLWARHLATVQRAYQLGVTLLPGTDGWGPIGWTLQVELEFFAEAGIPPLDILRFATQASAETVGAGDELGTLDVGKLADIVLLDANPLEDIKNTQAIWRVLKGGVVFDPEELMPSRN